MSSEDLRHPCCQYTIRYHEAGQQSPCETQLERLANRGNRRRWVDSDDEAMRYFGPGPYVEVGSARHLLRMGMALANAPLMTWGRLNIGDSGAGYLSGPGVIDDDDHAGACEMNNDSHGPYAAWLFGVMVRAK